MSELNWTERREVNANERSRLWTLGGLTSTFAMYVTQDHLLSVREPTVSSKTTTCVVLESILEVIKSVFLLFFSFVCLSVVGDHGAMQMHDAYKYRHHPQQLLHITVSCSIARAHVLDSEYT